MGKFISGCEKYPKELLEGRQTIEGSVIACIAKDLLLLDECGLTVNDFITQDGTYYFALLKHIRAQGIAVLDELSVLSSITDTMETGFNERGGYETLHNLVEVVNAKNWDALLDSLYKANIVLKLYDNGFNVISPITDSGKTIVPYELFKKLDSEGVLEWYESRLSTFGTGYSSKALEEEDIEFDDQFIEDCCAGLETGVPFDRFDDDINGEEVRCLPFLSNQLNGFMDGTFNILGGFSSVGKSSIWITIIMGLLYRGRKVLIISNEQKCKVFKVAVIVWLLYKRFHYMKITRKDMLNGNISEEDKRMIKVVQDYWDKTYKGKLKFIAIPDADMTFVKKKIREYVLRFGFDTVLYDTMKCDFSDTKDDKEWVRLIKDSREFDKLAKRFNIIMLASMQLSIAMQGRLWLDASTLSMSKQVKETCETLMLMRSVYQEELDPDNKKVYIRPFRRVQKNGKWVEEEFECDPTAVWRVLFVDKNRNGQDSAGDGVAYMLKFRGQYCCFSESCLCRPKHGTI